MAIGSSKRTLDPHVFDELSGIDQTFNSTVAQWLRLPIVIDAKAKGNYWPMIQNVTKA
jgi:hypothetical protein